MMTEETKAAKKSEFDERVEHWFQQLAENEKPFMKRKVNDIVRMKFAQTVKALRVKAREQDEERHFDAALTRRVLGAPNR